MFDILVIFGCQNSTDKVVLHYWRMFYQGTFKAVSLKLAFQTKLILIIIYLHSKSIDNILAQ